MNITPQKPYIPPGFPQFLRPSNNNTRISYLPGNVFVPNNVNQKMGRGVPYPPGSYPLYANETSSSRAPYPIRNYCPSEFENNSYRLPYLCGFQTSQFQAYTTRRS